MTPITANDTFTLAEISAEGPCLAGLDWLTTHWPEGRETWTVCEALKAGCDLSHALWALALREDNRRLIVAFACDCAERVLPLFEERCDDNRPRRAIEVTRAWLRGEASRDDVKAARDAAIAAAYAAAAAYADAAAYAAAAADAAAYDAAAYDAAAYDAAAYDAERAWQRARLLELLRPRLRYRVRVVGGVYMVDTSENGRITGTLAHYNLPALEWAVKALEQQGYEVEEE